ncbi:MAG: pantetheine-phosphate adenylyltransferase [Oscillospiraceae bacterium]|jgi:pantetheine-phosphate adenylyltransferase|nr:pantetheine-phosphate adenylyltransferase [Oscillospiraceae bacterium]
MGTAIYSGSFDPITLGHLNIIKRARIVFPRIIVCVTVNAGKSPLFTLDERIAQVALVTSKFPNVEVAVCDNLIAEFARINKANVIIRGLRALSDYEREFSMALVNKKLNPDLETFFLAADEKYMYHSSSGVKELARFGADLTGWCPREIIEPLTSRMEQITLGGKAQ